MSGPVKSCKERLKEFEAVLDEYTKGIGLSGVRFNMEIEPALTLTRNQILTMTVDDCSIFKLQLEQYAAFLQREFNRQKVRVDWAVRELDLTVAREASKFKTEENRYVKYELLRSSIIGSDESAKMLNEIIKHANARVLELDQLSTKVSLIARSLLDVRQMKTYEQYKTS